jgi:MOSC domain-containing protein YiiM
MTATMREGRLQREGHPIAPGAIGENLTIAELPWELMTPGRVVTIGDVQLELTKYADPCRTIALAFTGRQFGRVSQKRHPGWSRIYARVLREGRLSIGAPVIVDEAARP